MIKNWLIDKVDCVTLEFGFVTDKWTLLSQVWRSCNHQFISFSLHLYQALWYSHFTSWLPVPSVTCTLNLNLSQPIILEIQAHTVEIAIWWHHDLDLWPSNSYGGKSFSLVNNFTKVEGFTASHSSVMIMTYFVSDLYDLVTLTFDLHITPLVIH